MSKVSLIALDAFTHRKSWSKTLNGTLEEMFTVGLYKQRGNVYTCMPVHNIHAALQGQMVVQRDWALVFFLIQQSMKSFNIYCATLTWWAFT